MALAWSSLLELLAQLRLIDVTDRIWLATQTLHQELIDAEAVTAISTPVFERTNYRNRDSDRNLTTTDGAWT